MSSLPSAPNSVPTWWAWPWTPWAAAPQNLTQPINPGWTFGPVLNLTAANSSAPDTEREIVGRHSYGRQIGRLIDAVGLLLDERGTRAPADPRADDFRALQRDVEAIKLQAAQRRLDLLRSDLAALKRADRAAFERARAELRRLLDEEGA